MWEQTTAHEGYLWLLCLGPAQVAPHTPEMARTESAAFALLALAGRESLVQTMAVLEKEVIASKMMLE